MAEVVTGAGLMEIPGFQIEREVARGGMARVYLAVQKKFGRLVALKVVSADYARDVEFRKRFLQESRINARLTHPNIVQVYDAGSHGAVLYLVMEYIRNGDLNQRLASGMRMHDLVKVVRDIGNALDFAHSKGFVHRDIKPENILFREDGSAVLTDFGIARLIDSDPSITRAGIVVGTPHYMSPEQAAGREVDGQSDIYSLGVVLYRMLTGDVPYKADSAVSIGIKHLQDPIPRLPNYLSAFQAVIDECLAKRPEERFQTGAALSDALEAIRTDGLMPNATIKAAAVSTQEIEAVGSTMLTTSRDPGRADRNGRKRRRKRTVRSSLLLALLAAMLAGGTFVFLRQPEWVTQAMALIGVAEDPQVQVAWSNAQSLRRDPNQSLASIVSGYAQVLDLDPDHEGARTAVTGLRQQWRDDIDSALATDELVLAETKLNDWVTAFPGDPEIGVLQEQLSNRRRAQQLLSNTQALLRSHGMSDIPAANAAIQTFQEVLRLAPGNAAAEVELVALAEHYSELAIASANAGEVDAAIGYLDRASAARPKLPRLDDVRQKIQQATTLQAKIADLLTQAGSYRSAGALINPPGENAAEIYHRVLAIDPNNGIASQGLSELVSQLTVNTTTLIESGDLEGVSALVDRSSAVGLNPEAVNQIKTRLDAEISRLAAVERNLMEAEQLLRQGFVTEPQEGNAVSLLREVERLDPGNETAKALLASSAERLASVAREAYDAGLAEQARHYLELALAVTPDVDEWRQLRALWEEDGAIR